MIWVATSLAVAGALGAAWRTIPCQSTVVRRIAHPALIVPLAALAATVPGAVVAVGPVLGAAGAVAAVSDGIGRRPDGALVTLDLLGLGPDDRRAALVRELGWHPLAVGWRAGAALVAVPLLATGGVVASAGAVLAVATTLGVRWPRLSAPDTAARTGSAGDPGSIEPVRDGGAPGMPRVLEGAHDPAVALHGRGPAVAVPHDAYLYRALAGWNLGLGLDPEQAAWAGQLAGALGVREVLAEPAPLVDPADARGLAVCRAVATGRTVVLERPLQGLAKKDARRLAAFLAEHVPPERLVVLAGDRGEAEGIRRAYRARSA